MLICGENRYEFIEKEVAKSRGTPTQGQTDNEVKEDPLYALPENLKVVPLWASLLPAHSFSIDYSAAETCQGKFVGDLIWYADGDSRGNP